jgi:hypothetical protein
MDEPKLLQLAYELEWLGVELEYIGQKHAHQGFPNAGETWATFLIKQRGVLTTADKIQRELKAAVRFNPSTLVGVEFPLDQTLDSVTEMIGAVEDIRQTAVHAVQNLPAKVRAFTRMVTSYLDSVAARQE